MRAVPAVLPPRVRSASGCGSLRSDPCWLSCGRRSRPCGAARPDLSASSAPSLRPQCRPAAADRAWGAPPAATARGSRCPGFPCWCRRCRFMMPSMIFSSKVLSSSSSSPARTGPAAITRPTPKAMAASRSARAERAFLHHPEAGFGLAHRAVPIHIFCSRHAGHNSAPAGNIPLGSVSAGIRALLRRVPPGRNHTIGPLPRQQWPHPQG